MGNLTREQYKRKLQAMSLDELEIERKKAEFFYNDIQAASGNIATEELITAGHTLSLIEEQLTLMQKAQGTYKKPEGESEEEILEKMAEMQIDNVTTY